jgi:hypothetical protein
MLKNLVLSVTICLLASTANAQWDFDNSGSRVFNMKKNITNKTTVEIRYVKESEIQAACDAQGRKFGVGGFPGGALACSWQWPDRCVIIFPEKVDMRTVGHEMMHCLQGSWH